jgi:hypothetical protein
VITYRGLGARGRGRLGNQLWQIAGTLGIAARLGERVRFPPWPYAPYFSLPSELFGAVEPDALDSPDLVEHLPEFHRNYLQDLRLWADIEDEVRRYFTFAEPFIGVLADRFRPFVDMPTTAVHVRRGDYGSFGSDLFPVLGAEYYERAVERLPGSQILVFSDDPAWCQENFGGLGQQVSVAVGNSDIADLALMALCRHHVIANSTFSWWGAFLSGDTEVCYPSTWFGPRLSHECAEIFPPTWVEIPA